MMNKINYKNFATFVFVLLLGFVVASCSDNQEEIRKGINLGKKELFKGDLTSAAKQFIHVLTIDSTQCEAHLYLGDVYFNQAKYDLSMKEYNAAIRHNPKFGEAYKSRAQLWFVLDNRTKSCKDYLKAEALGVKNLVNYTGHCK